MIYLQFFAPDRVEDVLIDVAFNDAALPSGIAPSVAEITNRLLELVIAQIEAAKQSLDLAVYHIANSQVIAALNKSCSRGVIVRLVTEQSRASSQGFESCVSIEYAANERLMHHKFAVIDGKRVLTGSANWTDSSFFDDLNNIVLVDNAAVARAFESEFEEMFRFHRFGLQKRDQNEEHFHLAGGGDLEVFFGPGDRPKRRLLELIEGANSSIELALYALTDNDIYDALRAAQVRGVKLDAVWDFQSGEGCQFSEADDFEKEQIGVVEAGAGLLHHKLAVLDGQIVVTGSANWSQSGFEQNDENLLVIHSPGIAKLFRDQFLKIKGDALSFSADPLSPPRLEKRHFAITPHVALIEWRAHALGIVDRYEICRADAHTQADCERIKTLPGWSWYYIDRDVLPGRSYFYWVRAVSGGQSSDYSDTVAVHVTDQFPAVLGADGPADEFVGQPVLKRFTVTDVFLSESGNLFLNAGDDYRSDFSVFIPACAIERFNGSGIDLLGLQGRQIEVIGELQEFNGPEIVVTSPWQIYLVANDSNNY